MAKVFNSEAGWIFQSAHLIRIKIQESTKEDKRAILLNEHTNSSSRACAYHRYCEGAYAFLLNLYYCRCESEGKLNDALVWNSYACAY
jgi:hypothetical protein